MTRGGLSRRSALVAAASLPLAATVLTPRIAAAKAEMRGLGAPRFNRVKIGTFEVTTLSTMARPGDGKPQETFGTNADPAEFAALSAANFIPADRAFNTHTPTVVNTGAELVLFDTGIDPAAIVAVLGEAGYTPDQVDVVVLTHMHRDHVGGLMKDGAPTFPNARYVAGSVEHNHWMAANNETFEAAVKPLSDKMSMIDGEASVVSGITSLPSFGHSPGHLAYMLESGGQRLVITGDIANHPVWSLQKPDWEVRFDMDKAKAAAARKAVFGMIAADRIPFIGYHMPFPAVGFVEAMGEGFRYVPASYQFAFNG